MDGNLNQKIIYLINPNWKFLNKFNSHLLDITPNSSLNSEDNECDICIVHNERMNKPKSKIKYSGFSSERREFLLFSGVERAAKIYEFENIEDLNKFISQKKILFKINYTGLSKGVSILNKKQHSLLLNGIYVEHIDSDDNLLYKADYFLGRFVGISAWKTNGYEVIEDKPLKINDTSLIYFCEKNEFWMKYKKSSFSSVDFLISNNHPIAIEANTNNICPTYFMTDWNDFKERTRNIVKEEIL